MPAPAFALVPAAPRDRLVPQLVAVLAPAACAPGAAQAHGGRMQWNDAGNAITSPLADERSPRFRVGDVRLPPLDAGGGAPPSNAPGRTLTRTAAGR